MKTDKFNDAIRRKLESVHPPFEEAAWTRFQAQLPPPVVKPLWSQRLRWGMTAAAASVATVLLAGTAWLYHANQQQEGMIQALRQQVKTLQKNQEVAQRQEVVPQTMSPQTDTVYITRYIEKPVYQIIEVEPSVSEALADRDEPAANPSGYVSDKSVEGESVKTMPASSSRVNSAGRNSITEERYATRTNTPANTARHSNAKNKNSILSRSFNAAIREYLASKGATNHRRANKGLSSDITGSSDNYAQNNSLATSPKNLVLEPLESLGIRPDSVYFANLYAKRSRRVRMPSNPALTMPAVEEPVPLFRVRVGTGGEVGFGQWSLGLAGELMIGRHLVLSSGINRSLLTGDVFLTDVDFNLRTRKDFRKEYVPGIDLRHDITNIERESILWQIPISLGYRVEVGKQFFVTPTAGVNISTSSYERITFTYRRGPGDFNQSLTGFNRPNNWYHTWTVAMPLEKQFNRVSVQAGPFVNVPFQTAPNGFNTLSGGLRARVLYRF